VEFLFQLLHHLPDHLQIWALDYGMGLYAILALIIFAETGLIVTPFLPGDSLLFAVGAVLTLHLPGLDLVTMCFVLTLAAIFGNMVNYTVGKIMAPRLFQNPNARWLNRKHLDRTREFYDKHGALTVILTRFMPIIRTYAPFVAGLSGMSYTKFFLYNILGGALWVCSFLSLGYFFGNMPIIKSNFQYVMLGIIVFSLLPLAFEFLKGKKKSA
jgi:membrane-associated protein